MGNQALVSLPGKQPVEYSLQENQQQSHTVECRTYQIAEVAKIMGVSIDLIYDKVKRNQIPHISWAKGKKTRTVIPKDAFEIWFKESTVMPSGKGV